MVITKGQFRWLLIAMVAVDILGVIASEVGESSLPVPLRGYLAAEMETEFSSRDMVFGVVAFQALITYTVSIVGLFCFWRFARLLMVVFWIVLPVFTVFAGPSVEPGLATSLYALGTLLNGMVLAVIYMTPAKEWFERGIT